ncbi:cysteine desulfurase family protein (TIGR01976 family) [Microbacterium sp. SLBN-154]|uniref:cysteine desulfurase-like protein n=1 Tax=Microbacterium sp. SLBN-154 TaxID=2768458 RepID=UPI001152AD23|nr:cysteine desulfurase-like protein [Microbacterium sp. SLBN-154]TQK18344.1 cysteine desulfurase family protein (TIGR01976 family) [Microbacterium sp. SLBN-154]
MSFDIEGFRAQFPSLASGIAHFDGPGGTQTPLAVAEAIARTLTAPLSNRGSSVRSERNADDAVAAFRLAAADLLAADPRGVVYGRSATQLTYDLSRTLAASWAEGDEIVVSELDHDANVRPWVQAAEARGVSVRWLSLDPATAELDLSGLDEIVNDRTRLVAVTAASNLLGTIPPVARIAARAHAVGALVHVDGVHYAAHASVDVTALGADFFVCSPYKFFGPHCAVLVSDPALLETLHPDKLVPSTDQVPERFELGTLPYETLAGVTAAVDVIAGIAPPASSRRERLVAAHHLIERHETALRERIETRVAELGLEVHSRADRRTPTLYVTLGDRVASAASSFLAERDILAPSGSFYAWETFRALRLPVEAGMRIGVAAYTSDDDVDRLLEGLSEFLTR